MQLLHLEMLLVSLCKMIEVKNAKLIVGDATLFENLSFIVKEGSMVGLSGPSGSGKTTLLKSFMGFTTLNDGILSFDGEPITPTTSEYFRRYTAYIPQDTVFPYTTVQELVKLPFSLKANAHLSFSRELLFREWDMLDLSPTLYEKKTEEISGGERQRIMLSLCGLLEKRIILVDEPTSALDERTTALVGEYLKRFTIRGAAILAVSHSPVFLQYCHQIVQLRNNE